MRRGLPDVTADPLTAEPGGRDAELLLDFLATAPEPLRDWADGLAAEVRAGMGGEAPTSTPAPADQAGAEPAPSDLALAELGESDDDALRHPRIHTPMDKEHTPVPPRPGRRRNRPLVGLVAVALVGALIYGVFRIGQPATSAEPAPAQPTASAPQDDAARMAELEAKLVAAPNDVPATLELGVLRFNSGDVDGAEQLWLRVTELDPVNPQAWFNLGFVALAEDPPDAAAARQAWDKVLAVAPDSDLAATVRSHLDALEAASTPTTSQSAAVPSENGG